MIDLFGTAVTNGKREYRFKPYCPDSLLYLCVKDWSYPCSPGGREIAMGSTKPMGQALFLWHLSACSPEALWPSRKESSSVAFQFILLPLPYFPHLCFKLALDCIYSLLWTVWKVVIVCAYEYKPWWDWTTCLKCLLFFPVNRVPLTFSLRIDGSHWWSLNLQVHNPQHKYLLTKDTWCLSRAINKVLMLDNNLEMTF